MQKILIVDDEAPIREWLAFCLERAKYPCQILALARSGDEALAIARERRPDIVVTDIRMPGMSGLDLIEELLRLAPSTAIVVLSSHEDFGYVRRAMKAGAKEYILKTEITESLLVELLDRVGKKSRTAAGQDPGLLGQKRSILLGLLVDAATRGGRRPGTKELEECGLALADTALVAVALRFDPAAGIPPELDSEADPLLAFSNRISAAAWLPAGGERAVLVANISETLSQITRSRMYGDFIRELATHFHASAGASRIIGSLVGLPEVVTEALDCLDLDFYSGPGSWNRMDGQESVDVAPVLEASSRRIIEMALCGDAEAAKQALNEAADYLVRTRPLPVSIATQFVATIETALAGRSSGENHARTLPAPVKNAALLDKSAAHQETKAAHQDTKADTPAAFLSARISALATLIEACCAPGGGCGQDGRAYSAPVRKVIAHLESTSLRQASLAGMAALVRLTPDYFSRLFKEDTGVNFVLWLSELKVRRAMALLRETGLKVHEIADEVGYSNLGYFSKVFKKQTGLNPFEYRKGTD